MCFDYFLGGCDGSGSGLVLRSRRFIAAFEVRVLVAERRWAIRVWMWIRAGEAEVLNLVLAF